MVQPNTASVVNAITNGPFAVCRLWWNRLSHKFCFGVAAGITDSVAEMRRIENQD